MLFLFNDRPGRFRFEIVVKRYCALHMLGKPLSKLSIFRLEWVSKTTDMVWKIQLFFYEFQFCSAFGSLLSPGSQGVATLILRHRFSEVESQVEVARRFFTLFDQFFQVAFCHVAKISFFVLALRPLRISGATSLAYRFFDWICPDSLENFWLLLLKAIVEH